MDDRHAESRDRKRRKKRYGQTTTNPGLRIIMRDLARKARTAHGDEDDDHRDERDRPDRGSGPTTG